MVLELPDMKKKQDPHWYSPTAQQRFSMSYVAQISSRFCWVFTPHLFKLLCTLNTSGDFFYLALKAVWSQSLIFSAHLASLLYTYICTQFLLSRTKSTTQIEVDGIWTCQVCLHILHLPYRCLLATLGFVHFTSKVACFSVASSNDLTVRSQPKSCPKDAIFLWINCYPPGNYSNISPPLGALLSRWFSCSCLVGYGFVSWRVNDPQNSTARSPFFWHTPEKVVNKCAKLPLFPYNRGWSSTQ